MLTNGETFRWFLVIGLFSLFLITMTYKFSPFMTSFYFFLMQENENCNVPTSGDWVISEQNVTCANNNSISVMGNLIINGSSIVVFHNSTLFVGGSIFIKGNSKLTLNLTKLSMNISSGLTYPEFFNFTSYPNTTIVSVITGTCLDTVIVEPEGSTISIVISS